MTSKSLFFKLYKQENKSKIWYPLCIFVVLFLILEIPLLMRSEEIETNPFRYEYDLKHYFANEFLSIDRNLLVVSMTVAIAIFTAFILFSYVHSKQKLDLFHSIPIKRETMFWAKYFSGITFFVVPFIIQMAITFAIAGIKKCGSIHAVNNCLLFMATLIIVYLAVFSMTIICIMLTGNIVVSLAAVVVLQAYSYIITLLKRELVYKFFTTSVLDYVNPVWKISPIDMVHDLVYAFVKYREYNTGVTYRIILFKLCAIFIAAVIYSLFALVLYKYRKTENAGVAIAFPKFEPVIKFIVVIPVSIFAGTIFDEIARNDGHNWFIVGLVISFIISSIAMEIIFRFDFMSGLKHGYHMVFNGVCLALIVFIFDMDIMGYNSYVPNMSEIDTMSVSIQDLFEINGSIYPGGKYISSTVYRMDNVRLTDENTYALAVKLSKSDLNNVKSVLRRDYQENEKRNLHTIIYGYHLKNGKEVYRQYLYDIEDEDTKKMVAGIFERKEYKIGSMPIFRNGWNRNLCLIDCETNYSYNEIPLSEKEKNDFLNMYQNEYMKMTFDEALEHKPSARLDLASKTVSRGTEYENGYPVYDSFTETMRFLEEREAKFDMEELLNNATKVTLTYYNYKDVSDDDFPTVEYTDPEIIKDIVERGASYGCNGLTSYFFGYDKDFQIDIDVTYYDEDGDKNYNYMAFFKENYPEYVLKDFGLN